MDSDRVLVMNAGQVVEFDAPYTLLQKSGSWLASLVDEAHPQAKGILIGMAHTHFRKRASVTQRRNSIL
jgi:hypothetical protein